MNNILLMTTLLQLDIPVPTSNDTKDVMSILTYFLGLLLIILVIVITYLVKQNGKRFEEKDQSIKDRDVIIKEKKEQIVDIQLRLDKEIEYMKNLASMTTGVVSDSTNALKTTIKELEKLGIDVPDIKNIVKSNNDVVNDIKSQMNDHIINRNNK